MNDYVVCYKVSDPDQFLYALIAGTGSKSDHMVFRGTRKACSQYITKNQKKNATPSLKKILPTRGTIQLSPPRETNNEY